MRGRGFAFLRLPVGMGFQVLRSNRKTASIEVSRDRGVTVRVPATLKGDDLERLLLSRARWIEEKAAAAASAPPPVELSPEEEAELTDIAARVLPDKVRTYARRLGVMPVKVRITRARKRLGSCSAAGSLCFSCRLMLYPEEAIDYVVVHELAHLIHHNHSPAFHRCVASVLPDHVRRRGLLKKMPEG